VWRGVSSNPNKRVNYIIYHIEYRMDYQ